MDKIQLKAFSCRDCDIIPKVSDAGAVVGELQIMHNGLKIYRDCYHGAWMTELIRNCKGHHEPQEERAFYEVLKHLPPNSTMVEMGCSWAYYSMWFNQTIPGAKNFMFEISEDQLNIGKKNFQLNGLEGVFIVSNVQNLDFKNFINSYNINYIDLLHFDVQGWEYMMLQKVEKFLNKIGFMFISTHSDKLNDGQNWNCPRELLHEDCLEFLKKNDFKILCEHNINESSSNDGLIVAMNPKTDFTLDRIEITKMSQ